MTTTVYLVRHAAHGLLGRVLTGRMPGVRIAEAGQVQAEQLARRLAEERIVAVWSGPLERTCATAMPIARLLGLSVTIAPGLDEIDFGEWTGRSFEALARDPVWANWNSARSVTRPPGGETILEVQARAVAEIERARREHVSGGVVMVSHGDVIRAAVAYHLGLPVDCMLRFEVRPASISILQVGDWGALLERLNEVSA
jgi:broad specificity phosphatase PhoE